MAAAAVFTAGIVLGMNRKPLLFFVILFSFLLFLFYLIKKRIVKGTFLIFPFVMLTGYIIAAGSVNTGGIVSQLESGKDIP